MTRKYSVAEIDRMRTALIGRHPINESYSCGGGGGEMTPTEETYRRRYERARRVEDDLRTYMLNGTDPDEIDTPDRED